MKEISEPKKGRTVGFVTLYKDDLEEIVSLVERTLGWKPKVITDRYEYDTLAEFVSSQKEPRPKRLFITCIDAEFLIDKGSLELMFQAHSGTLPSICILLGRSLTLIYATADSIKMRGLTSKLRDILTKKRSPGRIIACALLIVLFVMGAGAIGFFAKIGFYRQYLGVASISLVVVFTHLLILSLALVVVRFMRGTLIVVEKTRQEASFWAKHGGALAVALIVAIVSAVATAIFRKLIP